MNYYFSECFVYFIVNILLFFVFTWLLYAIYTSWMPNYIAIFQDFDILLKNVLKLMSEILIGKPL